MALRINGRNSSEGGGPEAFGGGASATAGAGAIGADDGDVTPASLLESTAAISSSAGSSGGSDEALFRHDEETGLGVRKPAAAAVARRASSLTPSQVMMLTIAAPACGVIMILCNKLLMESFGFKFSALLVALHFFGSAVALSVMAALGVFDAVVIPWSDTLLLGLTGAAAIVLGNASLRTNSLGTFLATNMLTTPCTVLLRFAFENQVYPRRVLLALGLLVAGVAFHTLSDVTFSVSLGLPIALTSVVANACYQVLQKIKQDELNVNAAQMIHRIAPVIALAAFAYASVAEASGPAGFLAIELRPTTVGMLLLTCLAAVAANVSGGALIGATNPVTFQVAGYVKTIVLFVAALVLSMTAGSDGPQVRWGSIIGVPLAIVGAVLYARWNSK